MAPSTLIPLDSSTAALTDLVVLDEGALVHRDHPSLGTVYRWIRQYLCGPHPDLGRSGPVCPFVPTALQKRLLFAAVYPHGDKSPALDVAAVDAILLAEMERFLALEPVSGNEAQFKSVLVLFPGLSVESARTIIDAAQRELQRHFVPRGLMVGEFHAGPPPKAGLWNPDFRPLRCPVPALVIRHMVPTDLLFLKDDANLLDGYARIYGNAVPERLRPMYEAASRRFGRTPTAVGEAPQGAPRVMRLLAEAGCPYRVHRHEDFEEPIRQPEDFARALGYPLSRISKTLFLRAQGAERFVLVACGMDRKVDLAALGARLGDGRLEMASLDELQHRIGYPPTSVTPLGVEGVPVLVGADLLRHETVLTGSGVPRIEIEIAAADLVALSGATVFAADSEAELVASPTAGATAEPSAGPSAGPGRCPVRG